MSDSKRSSHNPPPFPRKSALLIVDVQNDFISGTLKANDAASILPVIANLRKLPFDLAVFSQDWHPKGHVSYATSHPNGKEFTSITLADGSTQMLWPEHCVQESPGAALAVTPGAKDLLIRKGTHIDVDSYSVFYDNNKAFKTELTGWLRQANIVDVYIAGLCLDYCVGWSALDAVDEGFKCFVVQDATRPVTQDGGGEMLGRLTRKGVTMLSSQYLFERRDDTRVDVAEYLKKHDINTLFEKLCATLLYNRPQDPYGFLASELKRIGQEKSRSAINLLTDADLETAWNEVDTGKKGSVGGQELARALTKIGVSPLPIDPAAPASYSFQQFKQFSASVLRR